MSGLGKVGKRGGSIYNLSPVPVVHAKVHRDFPVSFWSAWLREGNAHSWTVFMFRGKWLFLLFAASPRHSLSIWCFVGLVSAWHNEQVMAMDLVWFARVRCVGRQEKSYLPEFLHAVSIPEMNALIPLS